MRRREQQNQLRQTEECKQPGFWSLSRADTRLRKNTHHRGIWTMRTATILGNGTVVVVGGANSTNSALASAELYQ